MFRRILAIVTMAAVAASAMIVPAGAQEPAPEVPEVVQIEDPQGDANYLGDDQTTPQDLSVSDLLRVWFTNDVETISVHIQTEVPPPSANASYVYRVNINPGPEDELGCLAFEAVTEGPSYVGPSFGRLRYFCGDAEPVEAEMAIAEGPDGTGITTVTVPRDADPAFADDAMLAAPWAEVINNWGADGVQRVTIGTVDDTQVGTDYTVQGEEEKKKKKKKKKRRTTSTPRALLIV